VSLLCSVVVFGFFGWYVRIVLFMGVGGCVMVFMGFFVLVWKDVELVFVV